MKDVYGFVPSTLKPLYIVWLQDVASVSFEFSTGFPQKPHAPDVSPETAMFQASGVWMQSACKVEKKREGEDNRCRNVQDVSYTMCINVSTCAVSVSTDIICRNEHSQRSSSSYTVFFPGSRCPVFRGSEEKHRSVRGIPQWRSPDREAQVKQLWSGTSHVAIALGSNTGVTCQSTG